MYTKIYSPDQCSSHVWDDEHFPEFESGQDDSSAEGCEVVFIGVVDLPDHAVFSHAFDEAGDLL